jgi:hypothetical protein
MLSGFNMKLLNVLMIFVLSVYVYSSERAVSGPNQGITIFCAGTGCSAFGSSVLDLGNSNNWTLLLRIRFDPATNDSNHDIFSNTTLIGGAFSCAGIYIRAPKSGASWPIDVNLTITGGIGSLNIYSSSGNLTAGPWYSLAITHDTSHNWKTYINEVLDTSVNSNQPTIGTGCDMFIATVSGATDCGSSGLGGDTGCWFNDVALFSSTLGIEDIKSFSRGTRPNQLSVKPLAWYPMDGVCNGVLGTGTILADMSGNQRNAKMGSQPAPDYCAPATAQTNSNVMNPSGEATH